MYNGHGTRYAQSLSALSHLLLLVPQNPFYLLRHAETAYTLGDIPLAYKEMLRVIEMSDGVQAEGGPGLRAAIGVKLVRCVFALLHSLSRRLNAEELSRTVRCEARKISINSVSIEE